MSADWHPGPGWINTNPVYLILLIIFLTLPITLPIAWNAYRYFGRKREERSRSGELTEKQKKKLERDRRKDIKRQKRR